MREREKQTLARLYELHDSSTAALAERMTALEERLGTVDEGLAAHVTSEGQKVRAAIPNATVLHQSIADTVRHQHESTRADLTGRIRHWGEQVIQQVNAARSKSGETFFLGVVVGALAVVAALAFTGHIG